MIKTFEQFVAECYNKNVGKSVNEAFQSRKLRDIIKQHGKPKYDFEKEILYDLQDDEIVDVVDSRDEYWKKYSNTPEDSFDRSEATFMLELEDGACVVISNLGVLKSYFDGDLEGRMKKEIKKRHAERHKGNLGKFGGDEIHKKHMENVDKLERKRLVEKLQESIPEIVDAVDSEIKKETPDFDDNNQGFQEIEINLNGEKYNIDIYYECELSEPVRAHGVEGCNMTYWMDHFEVFNEDACVTNDELGVTLDTHKELFTEYDGGEIEIDIYDQYEYLGIKRSDFF